ncbi:hypothetical protein K3G63_22045 [Hymenobacter sp. HSC-4F20]|uniref:hypothetical protein n=1 Tax=Hymenobacter sp. HSC-4F20 TaxID=2864135 RepID=UPI001C72C4AB|nr:hypothetical protein [Hymenobacter sp. HSC-4F20]MBX0293143.1 hypothetical protein [Hymenobacter sp. HSC-4F20]
MKTRQINVITAQSTTSTSTKALDPDFISIPGLPDTRSADEPQPLQSWLKDSLLYMANNSPLDCVETAKVSKLLARPGFTQEAGLQLQEVLIRAIRQAEANRIKQLKNRIADRIHAYPELFTQTYFGRGRAQSYLSSISSDYISWNHLERIDVESEEGVQAWLDLYTLIDRALVDGEKMQQEMRRAMRKPGTTEADDQATIAQHLECFLKGRAGQGKYQMMEAARHLYEMLLDAKDPKRFINLVLLQLATVKDNLPELMASGQGPVSTLVDIPELKHLTQNLFVAYTDGADSEAIYRTISRIYRILLLLPAHDKSIDPLQQLMTDYRAS